MITSTVNISETENIELEALVNCVYQLSGYDFREYASASVYRTVMKEVERNKLKYIAELIPLIIHDPDKLEQLLQNLSINVTEFFRDPKLYRLLVDTIFPVLSSYPFIKIWHAGCANGKEPYSMAILLDEYGLLDKTLIYATDFNHKVLAQGKKGVYPRSEIDNLTEQYYRAGGKHSLERYFYSQYDSSQVSKRIKSRITFAHHNLVSDGVFGEVQLIVCKNVMIYFNSDLKQRVLQLFTDSLCPHGFLCLGTTESINGHNRHQNYACLPGTMNIFKKTGQQPSKEPPMERVSLL